METKSIFSINANLTGFISRDSEERNSTNPLHDFYYKMFPHFSHEFPYLSKIIFLQLVLRENIIIFTQDRVDVKEIWLSVSKVLELPKPQIYVIDKNINSDNLLTTENQYGRVLLYNVGKMTTETVNKLLNSTSQISIVGIQSPKDNVDPLIQDLFSMLILYEERQNVSTLMDSFNKKFSIETGFNKKSFNQYVTNNFETVIQQSEEEGFLQPFLRIIQLKLTKNRLKVPHSKWKKMLRILKFMGVNKSLGILKKLSLGDFVLSPELLATSIQNYEAIKKVVFQSLLLMIQFYGSQKFQRSIRNHFWFSNDHKLFVQKLINETNKNSISFFYPCIKYPDIAKVKINEENMDICYEVKGCQKKLMSDHHYAVNTQTEYTLSMKIRSDSQMIVHIGINCYDQTKKIIKPAQVCRNKDSSVIFHKLEQNKIFVENTQNLQKWSNNDEDFAFQRAIGSYLNGQTSNVIPFDSVVCSKFPFSTEQRPYQKIQFQKVGIKEMGKIQISPQSLQWFTDNTNLLQKGKSILMNHSDFFVGSIGQSISLLGSNEWKQIKFKYKDVAFENRGNNFFPGTSYIRASLMVNFDSGPPKFELKNKTTSFEFKNVELKSI